jgi:DNA repair photolyase
MLRYIRPFDPWKSKLCTCPQKYSFNPYTGCVHNCIYCYATYIPRFRELRVKKDLFKILRKDLEKLPKDAIISMSNSSDPYPPVERELEITRRCLEIMRCYDIKLLIVTKSDIVARDIDLFPEKTAVSITITCLKTAKIVEPNAPSPEKRIDALKTLKDCGIPVILRLDPIIPFLTEEEALKVLEMCYFVDHVVTSTLKLRRDILSRFSKVLPNLAKIYKNTYVRMGSYMYLPKEMRLKILKRIEDKCSELGISCAFCREGISFKSKSCDGTHLIHS